jgi:hypothetical protein
MPMREPFDRQRGLDQVAIGQVELDLDSRHELVPVLAGVQHIYRRPSLRDKILKLVERDVLGEHSGRQGAPGMDYWEILVLAAVRLGCNLDYDALHDLANNHRALRQTMGLDPWEGKLFKRSTIHENIGKLRTETIEEISRRIVAEGHRLVPQAARAVRGDGFVAETNIHYPTDASLIVDGVRVMLRLVARLSKLTGAAGWRQHKHLLKRAKKLVRKIGKAAKRRKDRAQALEALYRELLAHVRSIEERVLNTIATVQLARDELDLLTAFEVDQIIEDLMDFVAKTAYVCELAERRVLKGEAIPNAEKVFSLFEPHTELINRGKRPNPIEFGRRVVVVEDRVGFIVEFRVLPRGQLEQDILVPMMRELQERLNNKIREASFDRGFYTPQNLEALKDIVEVACLPKKGKVTGRALEEESRVEFRAARKRHAGIESAIHALEAGNGLDRCRDRGQAGYERYVALAVLGRNLHTLGRLVLNKSRRKRNAA